MEREKVMQICKLRGKSLLDIGVSPMARTATKDLGCEVTSIDVNEDELERERRKVKEEGLEDQIALEREDATALPYRANSFDAVISYGALHHTPIKQRRKFLLESFRVASEKLCVADFRKETFPHSKLERVNLSLLERG